MKTLLVLTGIILSSTAAHARPSTLDMSCAEARATVQEAGAIVLSTGANTYDRFVNHRGFCTQGEVTKAAYAPTNDSASCFIGYVCRQHDGRR